MAERLPARTAGVLAGVLDEGLLRVEREGRSRLQALRLRLVALDESEGEDPPLAPALADRLALCVDLRGLPDGLLRLPTPPLPWAASEAAAPLATEAALEALCAGAEALGVAGLRAPAMAWRTASLRARCAGREQVLAEDLIAATGLVLAPRASRRPLPEAEETAAVPPEDTPSAEPANPPPAPPEAPSEASPDGAVTEQSDPQPPPTSADAEPDAAAPAEPADPSPPPQALQDRLLEAAETLLPGGLLQGLRSPAGRLRQAGRGGGQGGLVLADRGRPLPPRPGRPVGGLRLALLDTLRAAAPWQRLRSGPAGPGPQPLQVRPEDLRVQRHAGRRPTLTVFAVDASGSAALHRLAEAKGAVEGLLAECYVRRDQVALLAFRGQGCELLLPPTRSLVRAKRCLAGMVGGGGTPLATGLQAARALAAAERRRGSSPFLVVLSDGRANVALDGQGGRPQAMAEALTVARACQADGLPALFIDTSAQIHPATLGLAQALGARYLPLPARGSAGLVALVQQARPA